MKKPAAKEETKQALIQAFWKLYREKRIEKITVGEIAAVAGYNRSTFYEYFYDVPDVLQQMPDRNNTNRSQSNSFWRFCTAETCQYVYYCLRSARAKSSENLLL